MASSRSALRLCTHVARNPRINNAASTIYHGNFSIILVRHNSSSVRDGLGIYERSREHTSAAQAQNDSERCLPAHPNAGSKQGQRRLFNTLLLEDDSNPRPDLKALDELAPRVGASRFSLTSSGSRAVQAWNNVVESVQNSFTVTQLRDLAKEAGISQSFLHKQRRTLKAGTVNKQVYARALVISRFGLADPNDELRARETAEAGPARRQRTVVHPMPLEASQLLFTFGRKKVQSVLRQNRVTLQPTRVDNQNSQHGYGVTLSGSDEGTENVKRWIIDFAENIVKRSTSLQSITSIPHAFLPTPFQLSAICRQSEALISIEQNPSHTVTILALNDSSAHLAQKLISRYAQRQAQLLRRSFYIFAFPSQATVGMDSDTLYSLVPHAQPPFSFDSVLSNDMGGLFRLTRQGLIDASAWGSANAKKHSKLLNVNSNSAEEKDNAQTLEASVFSDLHTELAYCSSEENYKTTFSAEFGHLLYSNNSLAPDVSDIDKLIVPPLEGTWPLSYMMQWLNSSNTEAKNLSSIVDTSRIPVFATSLPPIALKIESNQLSDLLRNQKNERTWQSILSSVSDVPASKIDLDTLNDKVLWNERSVSETLRLRYANARGNFLDVDISHDAAKSAPDKEAWNILSVRRSCQAEADTLVPEATHDVRFMARYQYPLSFDAFLDNNENIRAYCRSLNLSNFLLSTLSQGQWSGHMPEAPSCIKCNGEHFSLIDEGILQRTLWPIRGGKGERGGFINATSGQLVLDNFKDTDDKFARKSLKLECSPSDSQASAEHGSLRKEEIAWKWFRPFLEEIFGQAYRSIRGRQ